MGDIQLVKLKNTRSRYLKGALLGKLGFCTSWAVDVHGGENQWLEVVEIDLKLDNIGNGFRGKRIIQISDLHCSRTVSTRYLSHCIDRINQLDSDIVVLTGDYITHDYHGHFSKKVANLVSGIESRMGVYACLGNHDYGMGGLFNSHRPGALEKMVAHMQAGGVTVLRNDSALLEAAGEKLWLVGLGDLWAGDMKPHRAFEKVTGDGAVITLTHNPASLRSLSKFASDAVMCGHTHGIEIEWAASPNKPIARKRTLVSGLYHFGGKKVYVNRGLGRLGRTLGNQRPEITVFNLC